ncbi:hypothetical protein HPB47_023891 [Ixodes persulcatus]|uniref:Uncharacterized protein n=1 Tax=Ixodes persulcatus TaxID=34615 RepID=A0AC60Q7Z9_IXOPE|nr:hypothetical protein HPB47_023891 [Ixodes persulcatus]
MAAPQAAGDLMDLNKVEQEDQIFGQPEVSEDDDVKMVNLSLPLETCLKSDACLEADVCPKPHIKICPKCAVPNPPTHHVCTPKCIQCHGDHPTNDTSCPQRFDKPRATQRVSRPTRRAQHGGHGNTGRDRSNTRRQRNQLRSQSRPAFRLNSSPGQQPRGSPPVPQHTSAGASAKQKATSGQALKPDNTRTEHYTDMQQVSWETLLTGSQTLPPLPPPPTPSRSTHNNPPS